MSHAISTLRAFACCVLLAGGAAFAASPALTDDEAIAALQSAYMRSVQPGEQAQLYQDLFPVVLQRVKRSHVTEVNVPTLAAVAMKAIESVPSGTGEPGEVFRKSIREALLQLDPYARYIDPRAASNERGESSGNFAGLGLEVEPGEGVVRVVAPMPGSPAARAGVEAGDLILRVDDQPLFGVPLADAIARMRGQPGTPVSITIQRAGTAEAFTLSVVRETIRRPVLSLSSQGDVLVIRLAGFTLSVSESLERAIAQVTAERQPKAVVLDMRGNPGGLLREAVKIADTFLAKGDIVSVHGNTPGRYRTWQADPAEMLAGVPMVVLIDGRSASASELVADALRQNGRATVMGQRSFGKGSVQTTFPLGDNKGALKLTTALYHGPSGETLHHIGVGPDIELIAPVKTDATRAAPVNAPKAKVDPVRCTALKQRDPALSCAVDFLLAGSVETFVAKLSPVMH
ncbi:MAG: S41 family peptidase [Pseudomonadota bacterium]